MTADGAIAGAVEAMRLGALDYLVKPFDALELPLVIARARFFFQSRRGHTRCGRDWSSDVCSSDLCLGRLEGVGVHHNRRRTRRSRTSANRRCYNGHQHRQAFLGKTPLPPFFPSQFPQEPRLSRLIHGPRTRCRKPEPFTLSKTDRSSFSLLARETLKPVK